MALLRHLSLERVTSVEFITCEIPQGNQTFAQMLEGNHASVKVFSLTDPRNCTKCTLHPALFEGIASAIQTLSIKSDVLSVQLSDDFFREFSSLEKLVFRALSPSLPSSMKNLKKLAWLDISENSMRVISAECFSGMSALKVLIIAMFPAEKFAPRPFADLRNLEVLKLGGMVVTSVPDDLFHGLDKLSQLEVFHMPNLKSFPKNLFENTPSLETLGVSYMPQVHTLPEGLFRGLKNLKNCFIIGDGTGFETLPPNLWPVESLESVSISRTALRTLPDDFFPVGSSVRSLTMRRNRLHDVENGLKNLRKLETLNLTGNNLTSISATFFENFPLLISADLSYCHITSIDYRAFTRLTRLEDLFLNNNFIAELSAPEPVFPERNQLRQIDLSNNNLTEYPQLQLETLPYFSMLDLDHNSITSLRVTRFQSMQTGVSLKHNRIEKIYVDSVTGEGISGYGTHEFFIENNPIKCNGDNFEFFRYLTQGMKPELATFPDLDKCFCEGTGENFRNVRLESLFSEFKPCPVGCECSLYQLDKSLKAHCGNRGFSELPELPPNVTHLIFNQNLLISYPVELSKYRALRVINLDDNQIGSIDALLENIPEQLEEISVRNNKLQRWRPHGETLNFEIDLIDNPWICDCETKELKNFLQRNFKSVKNYKDIRCINPVRVNDTEEFLLSKISTEDLCPIDNTVLIVIGILTIVLFAIVLLTLILYYKNRNVVIAFIYVHFHNVFVCFFKDEEMDEDRKFDAFVSYSTNDRDVAIEILQYLEIEAKANDAIGEPFSLCLHERDFVPGQTITWNILNAVHTSRRTIMILSKEFLESMWFKIEFQAAYDQMLEDHINRLVIVIRGELPPLESLNENLQGVLRTKTYLVWGERWFWKKLVYAMPHRKRT